jgi:hypothetical protein
MQDDKEEEGNGREKKEPKAWEKRLLKAQLVSTRVGGYIEVRNLNGGLRSGGRR